MLTAFPTKKGTGLTIYGDEADLHSLYDTFSVFFTEDVPSIPEFESGFMTDICYNIRKAYNGRREKRTFHIGGSEIEYNGFNYTWPSLFFILAIARKRGSLFGHSRVDQANLLMLTQHAEHCLRAYDEKGADVLVRFLDNDMGLDDPLIAPAAQLMELTYMRGRANKARFRYLDQLITQHIDKNSALRQEFDTTLAVEALVQGGEATDMTVSAEWPDVVW